MASARLRFSRAEARSCMTVRSECRRPAPDRLRACRQELRRRPRRAAGSGGRRRLARGRRGRIPRHRRRLRLRQDHAAAAGQPADRRRRGHASRSRARTSARSIRSQLRRRIGYVFQSGGLFPHLSVADNIGITPKLLGRPAAEIAARVDELLDLVRLDRAQLPRPLSARTVGRPAPARRRRPRAGGEAAHRADGRAVRRARSADPRRARRRLSRRCTASSGSPPS